MLSSVSESMAIPMATMEFAALCLDNALLLLPDPPTAAATTATSDGSSEQRFVSVGGSGTEVSSVGYQHTWADISLYYRVTR